MKEFMAFLVAAIIATGFSFANENTTKADDDTTSVVTLGSSLTSSQKQGTTNTLTQSLNGASYKTITVTGSDLVKYLNPSGETFISSSGVWSGAMIQKTSSGSGINVKILNYNDSNNITTITANQYKNAALTAGVTNANIYIAGATPIDGSRALADMYTAYVQSGNTLNQSQVNAARNELNTLSSITQGNKNKDGYSDAQLNNAVAGVKADMTKCSSNITNNQITATINDQLERNNLTDVITNSQKQRIINLLITIKKSRALNSNSFKEQAQKLSSQIQEGAKSIFNKLNSQDTKDWIQKIIDAVANFFKGLFGGAIILN